MNKPMPPTPLRQEDYLAIEAAVMETARGRWFLNEYTRRNRNADTDTLLKAIDKLEKSIVRERAPATVMERVKMDLADMAAAIEKTKIEIAQIKHEDNEGAERFERASIELDAIVSQTESATGDILGAAEKIQEYAWTLREQGADEEKCNELDAEATNIYMACSFQDLTGQRIKKIVDAMRYVESRINSMIDIWGFESDGVQIDHMHAKSHDVRPDAHLLNGPALEGEGVNQSDVDVILTHPGDDHDANQDDVDALFDQLDGGEEAAEVEEDPFSGFDPVSTDDEPAAEAAEEEDPFSGFDPVSTDDEPAAEAAEEEDPFSGFDPISTDDEVAEDAELAEGAEFVDMSDLNWAEKQTDDADEEVSDYLETVEPEALAPHEEESADDTVEADIFASDTDVAEETAEDYTAFGGEEADADVFASVSAEAAEDAMEADADIFASVVGDVASDSDEEEESEETALEASGETGDLLDRVVDFS